MNNNEILNEYFIWEEKNLIEHQKNSENKNVSETNDTMTNTKTDSTQIDWRNITEPKLRAKVYKQLWYKENKDKITTKRKIYEEDNKIKILNRYKTYRDNNKDIIRFRKQIWYKNNKNKIRSSRNDYIKFQRKNNLQLKIKDSLRARLRSALKHNTKSGSAVRDLGCTIEEFKTYLESKFQPGMNWDNWSRDGWHIDHIKPLASFDLTDRKQLLEACHYTNLQPLWAQDNLSKSDKIL
jgi:hypothetical protein